MAFAPSSAATIVHRYKPPGSTSADYDIMALPVPYAANLPGSASRLLSAGDATHRQHRTSTWGAYASGLCKAQRIQLQLQPATVKDAAIAKAATAKAAAAQAITNSFQRMAIIQPGVRP